MVAIKGMKMPGNCIGCLFIKAEGTKFFCSRIMKYIDKNDLESKHNDCPLVDIITCKDCKHWKDSDGVYRRGIGAESKCPINSKEVFEGNFYCPIGERKG